MWSQRSRWGKESEFTPKARPVCCMSQYQETQPLFCPSTTLWARGPGKDNGYNAPTGWRACRSLWPCHFASGAFSLLKSQFRQRKTMSLSGGLEFWFWLFVVLFCFSFYLINLFHAHLLFASRSCNSTLLSVARQNNINKSITKTGWRDDVKSPETLPKVSGLVVKQPSLAGHQLTCTHMHE